MATPLRFMAQQCWLEHPTAYWGSCLIKLVDFLMDLVFFLGQRKACEDVYGSPEAFAQTRHGSHLLHN